MSDSLSSRTGDIDLEAKGSNGNKKKRSLSTCNIAFIGLDSVINRATPKHNAERAADLAAKEIVEEYPDLNPYRPEVRNIFLEAVNSHAADRIRSIRFQIGSHVKTRHVKQEEILARRRGLDVSHDEIKKLIGKIIIV
jgi:hypothetical protein